MSMKKIALRRRIASYLRMWKLETAMTDTCPIDTACRGFLTREYCFYDPLLYRGLSSCERKIIKRYHHDE